MILNIIKGVVSALLAAYFFMALYSLSFSGGSGLAASFIGFPIFGLLFTFWLIIPLGAILGIVIPKMISGCSWQIAALRGSLLGAGIGALVCLILSLIGLLPALREGHWQDFTVLLLAMMMYSAAWTGIYTFFCRSNFV